ncbi:MAG: TonB-dependent receptor, partial [Acidobacteria bacterium]
WAQEAEIAGTVTDSSGGAIPGVSITATNIETGLARTTLSNDVGQFLLPSLRIGRYNVKATLEGFKTAEQQDLILKVGDRARVDLQLQVGEVSETVTVASDSLAVKSETGEISEVITGQQVTQLATNGRTIYSLVALMPGTTSNLPDTQVPTSVGGNANVSFNGQRMSHNIYLIDGGENLDRGGAGTISVMPSIDAIAEFRALSSNYAPEYGLSSAGTMTMILQSGTSKYHASAWEFNRNDAYNARNFFQAKKTPVRFNVFGFNVSGPIIPTDNPKSFFFYNMEWRKSKSSSNFNRVVPLPGNYGGNFGATAINVPTAEQLSPAMQAKFAAAGLTLGAPFPNNTIPASLLDPAAQSLLKAGIFPAPTDGDRYVGSVPTPTDVREEIVRIDHAFSEKFSIFGHWISDHVDQTYNPTMWSGSNVPTVSNTFGNPSYSAVVHTVYTISPTLLMESAFNYNGNRIHILPAGLVARPNDFLSKELFEGNEEDRIPQIGLGGSTGATYSANWVPWNNKADDYQIRQDIAWTRGEHQFKFGASWAFYAKIQDLFTQTQGVFGFNGAYTGNDFADFLLGLANTYNEATVKDAGTWNNQSWAAYAQDHWRVNKQLALDFGLRWDGIPHTYEANHRMSNFYPSLYDSSKKAILLPSGTIDPSSPGLGTSPVPQMAGMSLYLNGIGITGVDGNPNGMTKDKWWNFGPRVGFAYDLTGAGKTVLRGGFGIMYERIQGNDMYNGGGNSPFSLNVNNNNVLLSDPSTSIQTGVAPPRPISVGSLQGISLTDYNPTTSYQYSFGVERELGKSVVSVAYVGNRTHYLSRNRQINIPDPSHLADLINGVGASYNTLLPYLGWGNIGMYENLDKSHYNSLQVSLRGQVASDLNLQGAYTLSRAIDPGNLGAGNGGDLNNMPNPYDETYGIGRSLTDRTHVATFNFIWDLPVMRNGSGVAKAIAGGWQMSGIVLAQTGNPLNITLGGKQGSNGVSGGTNRPNFSGSVSYPKTVGAWFDKAAFSTPTVGQWGNLEYGSIIGPGRHNWNLALFKSFEFNERGSRLEVRIESFNTWNHTQFSAVSSQFTASNFGQVTGVQDPRNLQLGLKLFY